MAAGTFTTTWKIYELQADLNTLNVQNVTYGLEGSLEFTHNSETHTYLDRRVGTATITVPTDPADIIPFASLTEQNIIDWITLDPASIDGRTGGLEVAGAAALVAELSSSLDNKRIEFETITVAPVELPWE